jgi:hypothetical protein
MILIGSPYFPLGGGAPSASGESNQRRPSARQKPAGQNFRAIWRRAPLISTKVKIKECRELRTFGGFVKFIEVDDARG